MLALVRSSAFLSDAANLWYRSFSPRAASPQFSAGQVAVVAQVGIHVRVLKVSVELVEGVSVRFCFVGHMLPAPRTSCCEQLSCPRSVSLLAACPLASSCVGHVASSSAVMLRAAVMSSLPACPMPHNVGVSSQLDLAQ